MNKETTPAAAAGVQADAKKAEGQAAARQQKSRRYNGGASVEAEGVAAAAARGDINAIKPSSSPRPAIASPAAHGADSGEGGSSECSSDCDAPMGAGRGQQAGARGGDAVANCTRLEAHAAPQVLPPLASAAHPVYQLTTDQRNEMQVPGAAGALSQPPKSGAYNDILQRLQQVKRASTQSAAARGALLSRADCGWQPPFLMQMLFAGTAPRRCSRRGRHACASGCMCLIVAIFHCSKAVRCVSLC